MKSNILDTWIPRQTMQLRLIISLACLAVGLQHAAADELAPRPGVVVTDTRTPSATPRPVVPGEGDRSIRALAWPLETLRLDTTVHHGRPGFTLADVLRLH